MLKNHQFILYFFCTSFLIGFFIQAEELKFNLKTQIQGPKLESWVKEKKYKENRVSGLISNFMQRRFERIANALASEKYKKALKIIDNSLGLKSLSDFEKSKLYKFKSRSYFALEQINDSLKASYRVIEVGGLGFSEEQEVLLLQGQALASLGQNAKSLEALEKWEFFSGAKRPQVSVLKASVLQQLERYHEATQEMEYAVNQTSPAPKSWQEFLGSLYAKVDQPEKATALFEKLLPEHIDENNLWQSWIVSLAKAKKKKQAFVGAEIQNTWLSDTKKPEVLKNNLMAMRFSEGVPFKAAQSLAAELENNKLKPTNPNLLRVAEAWTAAKEVDLAIEAYDKLLKQGGPAKAAMRMGYLSFQKADFKACEKSFKLALKKKLKFKQNQNAHLMRGMCQFYQKKYKLASQSFQKASKSKATKSQAQSMLSYISSRSTHQ